jgi:hypothetical protein
LYIGRGLCFAWSVQVGDPAARIEFDAPLGPCLPPGPEPSPELGPELSAAPAPAAPAAAAAGPSKASAAGSAAAAAAGSAAGAAAWAAGLGRAWRGGAGRAERAWRAATSAGQKGSKQCWLRISTVHEVTHGVRGVV